MVSPVKEEYVVYIYIYIVTRLNYFKHLSSIRLGKVNNS